MFFEIESERLSSILSLSRIFSPDQRHYLLRQTIDVQSVVERRRECAKCSFFLGKGLHFEVHCPMCQTTLFVCDKCIQDKAPFRLCLCEMKDGKIYIDYNVQLEGEKVNPEVPKEARFPTPTLLENGNHSCVQYSTLPPPKCTRSACRFLSFKCAILVPPPPPPPSPEEEEELSLAKPTSASLFLANGQRLPSLFNTVQTNVFIHITSPEKK